MPYDNQQVKDAPAVEPDGELSQEEEATLYRHYGLGYSEVPLGLRAAPRQRP